MYANKMHTDHNYSWVRSYLLTIGGAENCFRFGRWCGTIFGEKTPFLHVDEIFLAKKKEEFSCLPQIGLESSFEVLVFQFSPQPQRNDALSFDL